MKKLYFLSFFLLMPYILTAQSFNVVSTVPADGTTNVPSTPLVTTISVTFSETLDTNELNLNRTRTWISNLDSIVSYRYSNDLKTALIDCKLQDNKTYFVSFFYVKALSGSVITSPFVYYFTTGSTFPTGSVSGTVHSGSTGISPQNAMVGLLDYSLYDNNFIDVAYSAGWTKVNDDSTFTIPHVPNGIYWPIAIKDVNQNGIFDPEVDVDVLAFTEDSIVVNNAPVTEVTLIFNIARQTFHEAIPIAENLAASLPPDKVLRLVQAQYTDSLGRADTWKFTYTTSTTLYTVFVRAGNYISDTVSSNIGFNDQILQYKPLTNYSNAAQSSVVKAITEDAGGRAYRQDHSDSYTYIQMTLGDHTQDFWSQVPDTNQMYWGVKYVSFVDYGSGEDGIKYLCDFTDGHIIVDGVPLSVQEPANTPEKLELGQNYPNPFNPTTTIEYLIPHQAFTTLKVYDLLGREVATLVSEMKKTGNYHAQWNANGMPSGIYFYKLTAGNYVETKKMILLK